MNREAWSHYDKPYWPPRPDERTALAVGKEIQGWIREVDAERNRVSLTMREVPTGDPWEGVASRYEEGSVVEGKV